MSLPLDAEAQSTHRAFGEPLFTAILRTTPDDFVVHEQMALQPSGQGEHLWVHVQKRGLDTQDVRQALARAAGVGDRDVGHAGLKDRWAVTRQWLSVRMPGDTRDADVPTSLVETLGEDRVSVLSAKRHTRKLRVGAHRGNAFEIVLRQVLAPAGGAVDLLALQERVARVRATGFPNAFGVQRFGRDGGNIAQARALLTGSKRRLTRHKRGLLLSAARSHLFNQVLTARIERADWNTALPGEPLMLAGTRSVFVPDADATDIEARLASRDLSPTGPLPGGREQLVQDVCAAFENEVLRDESALVEGLGRAGVEASRRALRVDVPDLALDMPSEGTLRLRFSLPPGSYATTLLDQFGHCQTGISS